LMHEIESFEAPDEAGIDSVNVLLVGEVSAGKSSFFNSVDSVFKGRVMTKALTGVGNQWTAASLTTQYRQYQITTKGKNGRIKFRFCDTMGLEGGDAGLSPDDMAKIMDGRVRNQADLANGLQDMANAAEEDKIHCIAFCINAETLNWMADDIKMKIQSIREKAKKKNLHSVVILTRIDKVCEFTADNCSKAFHSAAVQEKVIEASEATGITLNQTFPVRNYTAEWECILDNDLLILRAFRQILRNAEDFLDDKIEREENEMKVITERMSELGGKKSTVGSAASASGGKLPPPPPGTKAPPPPPPSGRSGSMLHPFTGAREDNELKGMVVGDRVVHSGPDQGG